MRHLVWIAITLCVVAGAWLTVFGTRSPCDEMRRRAHALAQAEGGAWAKNVEQSVVTAPAEGFSTVQCISLSVSLAVMGKGAIKVVAK